MLRVIQEAKPTWIIGENVAGIVNLALDQVCADLEGQGYEVEPIIVPACAVDAPHRRDRVWIIARNMAYSDSRRLEGTVEKGWDCWNVKWSCSSNGEEALADAVNKGLQRTELCEAFGKSAGASRSASECFGIEGLCWPTEPSVGRVAHGIPNRVDRIKGLGNAIVPQVAEEIIRCINKIMEDNK
jgi:DNA (cytosine-5)-methyltransferase 1